MQIKLYAFLVANAIDDESPRVRSAEDRQLTENHTTHGVVLQALSSQTYMHASLRGFPHFDSNCYKELQPQPWQQQNQQITNNNSKAICNAQYSAKL